MTTDILELMQVIADKHNAPSDRCVSCKGSATFFKDELSHREYGISGLCQSCQDNVFVQDFIDDEEI